ncbi:UNKNOWN [Stylonychia lemnae]|uniref:Uncharacterized protein n=1 Tax=Stylonychia lemnae TaxID=5949 RepID=A0A078A379_STYLE|nr:UNKNOWN [Stylonychia lemnae]|eukprot:CDW75219.1 UNKNOWN [Stylonychia lemnae]
MNAMVIAIVKILDCHSRCSKCSLAITNKDCISCVQGYFLYNAKNYTCIQQCPNQAAQFYEKVIEDCIVCHEFCDGCTGPSSNDCIACKPPFKQMGSRCGTQLCPFGSYYNEQTNQCVNCEYPCEQCEESAYNCKTCLEGFAFDESGICTYCEDLIGFSMPWSFNQMIPGGGVCTEICGDGQNLGFYECDDGNLRNFDGCSIDCRIEAGFNCYTDIYNSSSICSQIRGPNFEIIKISSRNKLIYLQFDSNVVIDKKSLKTSDLIVNIYGLDQSPQFNMSGQVTKLLIEKRQLVLSFEQYFSVLGSNQVLIEIGFKNMSMIRDAKTGNKLSKQLSQPYYLNRFDYVSPETEAQAKKFGVTASRTSITALVTNILIQIIIGQALGSIWIAMNTLQIIYLMPLMNFANISDDFIGDPFFYKYMLLNQINDKPVSQNFEEYEFESSIFFFNYSRKMQMWAMFALGYPILKICNRFLKHRYFDVLKQYEQSYRFNVVWRVLTELYLEMTLTMNSHELDKEQVIQKHGVLYEGTKIAMPFESKLMNYSNIMNESLTGIAFAIAYNFTLTTTTEQQEFYFKKIRMFVLKKLGRNLENRDEKILNGSQLTISSQNAFINNLDDDTQLSEYQQTQDLKKFNPFQNLKMRQKAVPALLTSKRQRRLDQVQQLSLKSQKIIQGINQQKNEDSQGSSIEKIQKLSNQKEQINFEKVEDQEEEYDFEFLNQRFNKRQKARSQFNLKQTSRSAKSQGKWSKLSLHPLQHQDIVIQSENKKQK